MRSTTRAVLLASLAATALVALCAALGWLDTWEWWSQDQRFRHARLAPTRLSDKVRLVAIDDRALDTVGRWPWSRDVLALAIEEIARAGARTVATDVLLTDSQGATLAQPPSAFDTRLAEAIGSVPTVLAAHMDEGRLLGDMWQGAEGRKVLSDLTVAIVTDITAEAAGLADRANLDGPRRAAFMIRPSAFKKYALWSTLVQARRSGTSPGSFAEFRAEMTGGDRMLGSFAEELPIAEAFDRDRSFSHLAKFMVPGIADGSPLDAPPIAVIAARAGSLGFVNSRPDKDQQYRRVEPIWPTPYGGILQLGLAAALLQERLPAADARVSGNRLVLPDGDALPLVDGAIYVDWPSEMFEPVGVGAFELASRSTGVVAIGRLVNVAQQRQLLERLEARYRDLMQDIVGLQNLDAALVGPVPVDEAARAIIREHGEFLVGDLATVDAAADAGLGDEERRVAATYREWWRLDQDIPRARDLVRRAEQELRSELEGRLVFVGFMATGVMADMINTIYGARTPGVYFHAAIAGMVLDRHAIRFVPAWWGPVGALLLGVLASVLVSRLGAIASTTAMLAILGGCAAIAALWAFGARSWMVPMAAPLVAGAAAQLAGLGAAAFVNQREKARITRQFRARVSSQLVDRLVENPDSISVRGEQRTATILFGDLAGFTTISERLGSEAVVATLNLYMGALATELSGKRAYVNKFLGDGLLAFWSAFGAEPEQCDLALRACVECQRRVREIGRRPDRAGLPPVSLRLGVATGVVTVGDCGAPPDLNDYTVIGDAANLAARLESANKQFGTAVLFDGGTRAGLAHGDDLPILRLGRVVVVGQSVPVDLYTLLVEEPPAGWVEAVTAAVAAFEAGDREACRRALDDLEARFGPSKLVAPYRQALDDPEDLRDGVLRLRAK